MGYFKAGKGTKEMEIQNKETVKEIQTYPFVEAKDRKITKETCEKLGIRAGLSTKDGKTVEAYYFPSYNQKGKIVGYTKQDITKDKSEKGHWSTIGSVVIGNKLFGQNVAEAVSRSRKNIILTEGQWDAASTWQALVESVKGTQYENLEPQVCSIPLGTANAVESLLHNKEFVTSFESAVFFFDNDQCTPAELKKGIMKGYEAREACASALIGEGVSLFTIEATGNFKDASDYVQNGQSATLAKLVKFEKRVFNTEKIIRASDISFEELITPQKQGMMLKAFPKTSERLYGLRDRELTMILAPSGVGKTTVCSIIAGEAMEAGEKIGMIFLEENNKDTLQRMVAAELKVNYLKFKRNPLSVATEEQIREVYDRITNNDQLILMDHFGSMPIDGLMTKVKHMVLVEGCKKIFLDHISMVISGNEVENERKELDIAMTNLASFCAAHDVHLFVICHINRTDSQQFLPPKGEEDKPFWVNVRKESARGSAALEQFSWNILGIEPEINPDFTRGRVRIKVLKTRFGDSLGIADVFTLDQDTWEVRLDTSAF